MATKDLSPMQVVNIYCNVRGVHLSDSDREALAKLFGEIAFTGHAGGKEEMQKYENAVQRIRERLSEIPSDELDTFGCFVKGVVDSVG